MNHAMRRRRAPLVLLLSALLLGGGAACGGQPGDAIRLGVAGPMELVYGRSMLRAAEMAVDEINAEGLLGSRRLELSVADDAADPSRAIEVATGFRDDPSVVAVIGHVTSGATLAAAEVYNDEENGLLELSPSASSPQVSDAGEWTFRVCPSDLEHGPALARWIRDRVGGSRAAILYANDAYGRGVLFSFTDAFSLAGGEVITRDPFLPSLMEEADAVDPYLRRAMREGLDALVIAGLADEAIAIIRAARRLGYTGPILGADGLVGIEEAGSVTEGILVSAPFLPDAPTPAARDFVDRYAERYGQPPDAYAALTYDAVRIVARAIAEAGTDRRAVRDYVASLGAGRPPFEGVTGAIAFDERGDVRDKPVHIGVIRDGRIRTAAGI